MKGLFVERGRLSLCNMCTALCCQSVEMPLTQDELQFMKRGGANPVLRGNCFSDGTPAKSKNTIKLLFSRLRSGNRQNRQRSNVDNTKIYYIPRCGYLKKRPSTEKGGLGQLYCSAHDDIRRPAICTNFRSGSYGCLMARKQAGLDSPKLDVCWDE